MKFSPPLKCQAAMIFSSKMHFITKAQWWLWSIVFETVQSKSWFYQQHVGSQISDAVENAQIRPHLKFEDNVNILRSEVGKTFLFLHFSILFISEKFGCVRVCNELNQMSAAAAAASDILTNRNNILAKLIE